MLDPTSSLRRVSLMASEGTSLEKEERFSLRTESSMTSQPCSKRPQRRVNHSFLRQEMTKMTSMRRGQVTREKGKLQGSTSQIPIQIIVDTMNVMFPLKVQIPPNLELLFSSCTRRQDRVTPGMMMSITGSHEHFLKRLLTRSGTSMKMGEESSPAQSLQERGRRQWSTTEMTVTVTTMMLMARQLCLRESKWKILMLPTHTHTAIVLYSSQLSERKAKIVVPTVSSPLTRSQYLTPLYTLRLSSFFRNRISLKQRNTKKIDITTPRQRMMTVALEKSLKVRKQRAKTTPTPIALKMRKGFQKSTYLSGRWLILMDQTWECMATPMMMAESMRAISKYPSSNFLWRLSGSQFTRKLKEQEGCTSTFTLLKQVESEHSLSFPQLQLNSTTKCVSLASFMQDEGSGLGEEVIAMSALVRVGMLLQATTSWLSVFQSMMLRLPLRQLRASSKVLSLQSSLSTPSLQMQASELSLRM